MALKVKSVSQCLDKKLLVFGYEIPDLLAIFFVLSVLNFVSAPLGMKLITVWLPTAALALALRLGKRGKPDNYLPHLIQFKLRPKYLSAFLDSSKFLIPPRLKG